MHRADVKGRTGRSTPRMRGSTAKDARLRETEQQLAEALQQQVATADVLKVISRWHFDLKAVLNALVRSVSRLCNVDATSIVEKHRREVLRGRNLRRQPVIHRVYLELPVRAGARHGGRAHFPRRAGGADSRMCSPTPNTR